MVLQDWYYTCMRLCKRVLPLVPWYVHVCTSVRPYVRTYVLRTYHGTKVPWYVHVYHGINARVLEYQVLVPWYQWYHTHGAMVLWYHGTVLHVYLVRTINVIVRT